MTPSSNHDHMLSLPNWVRAVDTVALAIVGLILAGGFFCEGYVTQLQWRGWAFAGCALLGAWGAAGLLLGRWSGRPRAAAAWIVAAGLAAAAWSAVQVRPMPAERIASLSPVWGHIAGDFAEAGVSLRPHIPLAHSPAKGALSWEQLVASIGFFLGVACLATRRGSSIVLLMLMGVVTVAEGAFGAWTFLVEGAPRAYGGAWNPNHHAALTLMGIPVLLAGLVELRRQVPRFSEPLLSGRNPLILVFFLVGVALLGWGAGLSRASILIGVAVLAGWGVLELSGVLASARRTGGVRELWRHAGGALVTAVLLGLGVFLLMLAAVPEGVARRGFSADPGILTRRVEFWRAGLEALAETPWLGLGPGGMEQALTRFVRVPTFKNPVHAHNDYIEAVAELGLPASLVVGALLLLAMVRWAAESRRRAGDFDRDERLLQRACTAGVLTVLLHSLVDFPLRIPLVGFAFLILLALAVNPGPLLVAGYGRQR